MTEKEVNQEIVIEGEDLSDLDESETSAEVVNLVGTTVGTVKADLVRLSQSGAQKIVAAEVGLKHMPQRL